MITKIDRCRICRSRGLTRFLDLGPIPLPNGFLSPDQLNRPEPAYPLSVGVCPECGLVQLVDLVDPRIMFRNYAYIPSASKTRLDNFRRIVTESLNLFPAQADSLAVDIGSNDGSLLLEFKKRGISTLGIDPAANLARIAELKGIHTLNQFFSTKLARTIKRNQGRASHVTATNVVAHIGDLKDFFSAVRIILQPQGIFTCEFPYLVDLLQKKLFDTIYQEHLSYFAVQPLLRLISDNRLKIVKIRRTPIDGGALRLNLARDDSIYPQAKSSLKKLLNLEQSLGLDRPAVYRQFAREVIQLKRQITSTLKQLKAAGHSIAGYGAAARGNILINYCRIGKYIDFVVDSTPYKQGLFTPGSHIPIFPESEIINRRPDYVLILAWNFAREIIAKQRHYQQLGGKFIIPVPYVHII